VPWLQEGGQVRLAGSASMDGFVSYPHWITMHGQPHIRILYKLVAHHQESQLYQYDLWYMSLYVGVALGCSKHVENWDKQI